MRCERKHCSILWLSEDLTAWIHREDKLWIGKLFRSFRRFHQRFDLPEWILVSVKALVTYKTFVLQGFWVPHWPAIYSNLQRDTGFLRHEAYQLRCMNAWGSRRMTWPYLCDCSILLGWRSPWFCRVQHLLVHFWVFSKSSYPSLEEILGWKLWPTISWRIQVFSLKDFGNQEIPKNLRILIFENLKQFGNLYI